MFRAGAILDSLIREIGVEDEVRLVRIKNKWTSIFREPLTSHMAPSRLSGEELSINVDSPIWMQQLRFYEAEITGKLLPYGVKTIRFRLGKVGKYSREISDQQTRRTLSRDENLFISETVSPIEDEEVRESVRRAMEKQMQKDR